MEIIRREAYGTQTGTASSPKRRAIEKEFGAKQVPQARALVNK